MFLYRHVACTDTVSMWFTIDLLLSLWIVYGGYWQLHIARYSRPYVAIHVIHYWITPIAQFLWGLEGLLFSLGISTKAKPEGIHDGCDGALTTMFVVSIVQLVLSLLICCGCIADKNRRPR